MDKRKHEDKIMQLDQSPGYSVFAGIIRSSPFSPR